MTFLDLASYAWSAGIPLLLLVGACVGIVILLKGFAEGKYASDTKTVRSWKIIQIVVLAILIYFLGQSAWSVILASF